jgi:hypothetical protein
MTPTDASGERERLIADLRDIGEGWPAALIEAELRAADQIEKDGLTLETSRLRIEALTAEVTALRAEREALTAENLDLCADAERYRWLRKVQLVNTDETWIDNNIKYDADAALTTQRTHSATRTIDEGMK